MDSIQIQIPSMAENVRIIESFIDNAKDQFALNDDIYGNIMIAVTESVNNAILHGNKADKNKSVDIKLRMEENAIKFSVEDEGEGFEYEELPDPTAPENLTKTGGRGIFLMRHLCDEVNFKENGRVVELTFYL